MAFPHTKNPHHQHHRSSSPRSAFPPIPAFSRISAFRIPAFRIPAFRIPAFAALGLMAATTLLLSGLAITGAGPLVQLPPAAADSAPTNPAAPATPPTVTGDVLPTVQVDGVVWSQAVVGNTVYVAGKFGTARPAGMDPHVQTVERHNLLAYDIRTGTLIDGFAPDLNAQALAVAPSPDGKRLYVTGDFTRVDGEPFYRLVAFDTTTGAILPAFDPVLGSQGRAIVATATTVYVGGTFRQVDGKSRKFIAAVHASDGTVTSWAPVANSVVNALALTKKDAKLVVGGRFTRLAGKKVRGLSAVSTATGKSAIWAASSIVRNSGTAGAVTSLISTADRVYGTGYTLGRAGGNLEGAFSADASTGAIKWVEDCHGDTYSLFPHKDVVYVASHSHDCTNIGGFGQTSPPQRSLAFSKAATHTIKKDKKGYFNWAGTPTPALQSWFPTISAGKITGLGQGAWSITGNDEYVVIGGEFLSVNGVAQQGLARFTVATNAPNQMGVAASAQLAPEASASPTAGVVDLSWRTSFDPDNRTLRYTLVRDGDTASPVAVVSRDSTFFSRPTIRFVDRTVPAGVHRYTVYASDPFGNTVSQDGADVTVEQGPATTNAPPTASFTAGQADAPSLSVAFSSSATSDADGTISSYEWSFGDGTAATGAAPSHVYSAAGTYPVILTVRDNLGAIGTFTRAVVVSRAGQQLLAADSFSRTTERGWDAADRGGDWSIAGNRSSLTVEDGVGTVSLAPGSTRAAVLPDVSTTASDTQVTFVLDGAGATHAGYATVIGREVGTSAYTASIWAKHDSAPLLVIHRDDVVLATVPLLTIAGTDSAGLAGKRVTLRLEVTGASPTTLRARAWDADHTEPFVWDAVTTDGDAPLQAAGTVGLQAYLPPAATEGSLTTFDQFSSRTAG